MTDNADCTYEGHVLDNKYEVQKLLGKGGMGAVYEAKHLLIGRRVAVKFVHSEYAGNKEVLQRFQQEARIAGQLGHPNICEVTDIGYAPDGAPYMVMPYLDGETLSDAMQQGQVAVSRALDIMDQLLSALGAAHEAGIIHRDLKPENIFLVHAGDRRDFVKILDFGISKVVSADPALKALTMTGVVMGTPYYMAPEQARGSKHVDHRSDIYSAGVILYELLTGRKPFEAETFNELIIKIATEPFAPPRSLRADIPQAVERVVLKAMARESADRFPTIAELREALIQRAGDTGLDLPLHLTRQLGTPSQDAAASAAAAEFTDERPERSAPSDEDAKPRQLRADDDPDAPSASPTASTAMAAASLGAGKRRAALIGGLGGAIALGVGLVLFLATPWMSTDNASSSSSVGSRAAPASAATTSSEEVDRDGSAAPTKPAPAARKDQVTIQFVGLPADAVVNVDGKPLDDKRLTASRSDKPISYRISAPGHEELTGEVEPSQDRILSPSLSRRRARAYRRSEERARRRRRARPRRRMSASFARRSARTRSAPPRARRAAPRRARARARIAPRTRTVRGRRGTEINLGYDDEE